MNRSILVIEDDADVREVLVDVLVAEGLRVYSATHGAEALAWLRQGHTRPSVILLDLAMPVVDGVTFIDELLADRVLRSIPVIAVTAQTALSPAVRAAVLTVLTKPVELNVLLETVHQASAS